jgi:hypothetical protein
MSEGQKVLIVNDDRYGRLAQYGKIYAIGRHPFFDENKGERNCAVEFSDGTLHSYKRRQLLRIPPLI